MPTYIHELQYPLYLIAGTSLKRGDAVTVRTYNAYLAVQ